MKTHKRLFIPIFALSILGCNDFLRESSQDEMRPSVIGDLEQILLGDGYRNDHSFYYASEIFTDNMASYGVTNASEREIHDSRKWSYIWSKLMFDEEGGGYNATFWEKPYSCILGCNLVLDYLDEMEGDDRLRENLRGEALTLRAWYHFHLVNFWGIAYNQGNPQTNPGIPLRLNSSVTGEFYKRNSVKEVYDQIEQDLLKGNDLLTKYKFKRNFYRIGNLAAKAMLSRLYLYKEEWDKAIAYADSVLDLKSTLLDFNTLSWKPRPQGYIRHPYSVYNIEYPDEIIWMRYYENIYNHNNNEPFMVADIEYDGSFQEAAQGKIKDLRGCVYFQWDNETKRIIAVLKGKKSPGYPQGIRTAELYLNKAEAYAQKYKKDKNEDFRKAAIDNLNKLRKSRYNVKFYEELDITDASELLQYCIDERRRELIFETNHRWCDLRRYGITVKHILKEKGERPEFTCDMTYYTLPIPKLVLERNPNLTQNQ